MNNCSFIGRLANGPTIRITNNNKKYASFCLAVSDGKDETDWIDCIAWEKLADNIETYFKKGNRIAITGKIKTNTYETNGVKRKDTRCLVLSFDFIEKKETPVQVETPQETPSFDFGIEREDLLF